MSEQDTYIHGTEPTEQERLAALNRMTNKPFVDFLSIQPDMQVLEVGSGLGLLAAEVASAATRVQVVGIGAVACTNRGSGERPQRTLCSGRRP